MNFGTVRGAWSRSRPGQLYPAYRSPRTIQIGNSPLRSQYELGREETLPLEINFGRVASSLSL